ncbi:MAG: hypothetical protein JZU59_12395 [Chromatium okenii]|nr:ProQ/FINO family protein [Chromatium okenii]MBV5310179.1 hypothetical protein [Chromatium okenii]
MNDKPEAQPKRTPQRELIELYPDCFNLKKPRPLKVGIRQDLLAAGHASKLVNSVASASLISRRCESVRHGLIYRGNPLVK